MIPPLRGGAGEVYHYLLTDYALTITLLLRYYIITTEAIMLCYAPPRGGASNKPAETPDGTMGGSEAIHPSSSAHSFF